MNPLPGGLQQQEKPINNLSCTHPMLIKCQVYCSGNQESNSIDIQHESRATPISRSTKHNSGKKSPSTGRQFVTSFVELFLVSFDNKCKHQGWIYGNLNLGVLGKLSGWNFATLSWMIYMRVE